MHDRTGAPVRDRWGPGNRLLAALPPDVLFGLRRHLEPVALLRGEVLCEAGEGLRRAYFVETGVVALLAVFQNGTPGVMATVGCEGMVGLDVITGGEAAFGRQVVQVHGSALAVEVSELRRALQESAALCAICQGYAQAFLGQVLQTTACNSVHSVEQRCARWLLISHDRSDDDTVALTEELLAQMLGVSQSAARAATRTLQETGRIRSHRGVITVLDRPGLEAAGCECYGWDRGRYERFLPGAC